MKLDKITARGVNNLYRHPGTQVIYYRKYANGAEVMRSCRTTSLEEAKKVAETIAFKTIKSRPKTNQRKSALELYDLWVTRKESLNKSANTITSIKASRNFFEEYLEIMMPQEITAEWWESTFIPETKFLRFKSILNADGTRIRQKLKRKGARKFENDWKWMSSFMKQLAADGIIASQPKLINPDPEREVGKVYTDEEVQTLIGMAQTEDLKLAIEMAVTMGMRRLEIFALRSDRVDVAAGIIRLKATDTKTRKARSFAISPSTKDRILARAQAGVWVFPTAADQNRSVHKDGYMTAWRNLKLITGIDGRFHFFRHTFLTKAFRAKGSNAALICFYAGLSLEVAQQVYLHFTEDDTKHVAELVSYEN